MPGERLSMRQIGGAFWRMFLGPLAYPGTITPQRWESPHSLGSMAAGSPRSHPRQETQPFKVPAAVWIR